MCATAILLGQIPPYGGTAEYVADLTARRAKTMEAIGPESVLVIWSAPPRVYSADIDYEFRQDSNLLYLTGIDQEDTILVLVPGATGRKEVLFTRAPDPLSELWTGHILAPVEVTARSGIAAVVPERGHEAFDAFITGLLGGTGFRQSPDEAAAEFGALFAAEREGRARLHVIGRVLAGDAVATSADSPEAQAHAAWAVGEQQKFTGVIAGDASAVLTKQRQVKTPYEQRLLRRSVEISAEAHVEGMKAARPGRWEYEVEAAVEYWFLDHGMLSWGYPSIVASGPNATTLHYLKSTRQMNAGDLLLVDAAGNFQGLTGDITRTYPVSGRFSADQRAIYDLVLQAQEAGIAAARPGGRQADVVAAIRDVFALGLRRLGLVTDSAGALDEKAQVSLWFPHGPVHGIGVDVHDPLGTLDPGAAFVIEPGLYIRPDVLQGLEDAPQTAALAARLRPAVERFANIGVRVEDSFLMTPAGPEMLSAKAPRQVADLERVVGTGR
jgi:Xaa-Pro aminopeptidase